MIKHIMKKIMENRMTWSDYEELISYDFQQIEPVLKQAYKLKVQNFGKRLKVYIPNKNFPAISITGRECSLNCEHCNKKYLKDMKPLLTNRDLKQFLINLYKEEGVGALISGGCDPNGAVPLKKFLSTIKEVKQQTNLIINVHTGLINKDTAQKLTDSTADIISFDINMDEKIIQEIYHLDKTVEDYKKSLELLQKNNLNIVPHVCFGLYYGRIHEELRSIKFIKESIPNPSLIVIIALIPPPKNSKFKIPKSEDISKLIAITRLIFPQTEISLGCMRPRGSIKKEIEQLALKAGITRIEIPSKATLLWMKKYDPNVTFEFYSACCAIPEKYEKIARSKEEDIKSYKLFISGEK
ncbi:MAG: radical SAM protein [Promethearchaeota archaeon]